MTKNNVVRIQDIRNKTERDNLLRRALAVKLSGSNTEAEVIKAEDGFKNFKINDMPAGKEKNSLIGRAIAVGLTGDYTEAQIVDAETRHLSGDSAAKEVMDANGKLPKNK